MKKRILRITLLVLAVAIAGYCIELAIPKYSYFWERAGEIAADAVFATEAGNSIDDGIIDETVSLVSTSGLTAELRVRRPASSEPVPVLLVLGGYDTGKDAVELAGARDDVAFAALDYPYSGEESLSGFYRTLRAVPDVQQAFLDSPAALLLALDWLDAEPWVDRVELVGASLGVPFTAVAGALDDRFSRVWLLHGAADNFAWAASGGRREMDNDFLGGLAARTVLFLCYGNSFDTVEWVRRTAPRKVVIVMARNDDFVPPEAQQGFVEIDDEMHVEIIWTEGRHIMPGRPNELGELLDVVLQRVASPDVVPDGT